MLQPDLRETGSLMRSLQNSHWVLSWLGLQQAGEPEKKKCRVSPHTETRAVCTSGFRIAAARGTGIKPAGGASGSTLGLGINPGTAGNGSRFGAGRNPVGGARGSGLGTSRGDSFGLEVAGGVPRSGLGTVWEEEFGFGAGVALERARCSLVLARPIRLVKPTASASPSTELPGFTGQFVLGADVNDFSSFRGGRMLQHSTQFRLGEEEEEGWWQLLQDTRYINNQVDPGTHTVDSNCQIHFNYSIKGELRSYHKEAVECVRTLLFFTGPPDGCVVLILFMPQKDFRLTESRNKEESDEAAETSCSSTTPGSGHLAENRHTHTQSCEERELRTEHRVHDSTQRAWHPSYKHTPHLTIGAFGVPQPAAAQFAQLHDGLHLQTYDDHQAPVPESGLYCLHQALRSAPPFDRMIHRSAGPPWWCAEEKNQSLLCSDAEFPTLLEQESAQTGDELEIKMEKKMEMIPQEQVRDDGAKLELVLVPGEKLSLSLKHTGTNKHTRRHARPPGPCTRFRSDTQLGRSVCSLFMTYELVMSVSGNRQTNPVYDDWDAVGHEGASSQPLISPPGFVFSLQQANEALHHQHPVNPNSLLPLLNSDPPDQKPIMPIPLDHKPPLSAAELLKDNVASGTGVGGSGNGPMPAIKKEPKSKTPFICGYCNKAFRDSYHLRRHESCHTGIKMVSRPKKTAQAAPTMVPLISSMPRETPGDPSYISTVAGILSTATTSASSASTIMSPASMSPMTNVSQHTHNVPKKPPKPVKKNHGCEMCGKAFRDVYHLNRHKLSHSDEKPFECPICQQRFKRKDRMTYHVRSHDGGVHKPYVCPVCGKGFSRPDHLSCHVKHVHSSERPFKCQVTACTSAFATKDRLRSHMIRHEGKVTCNVCGKMLSAAYITSHLKTHGQNNFNNNNNNCNKGDWQWNHSGLRKDNHEVCNSASNAPVTPVAPITSTMNRGNPSIPVTISAQMNISTNTVNICSPVSLQHPVTVTGPVNITSVNIPASGSMNIAHPVTITTPMPMNIATPLNIAMRPMDSMPFLSQVLPSSPW
ncbi:hypothetical protein DNTS_031189 [Danionella cerebrum]|uniref:Myc-associated zinc finger protein n=1 Tax=Danionella cerebrum TaxID=2873325 RepID=A0A553QFX0_9TELE|nr:hypothetical protein DNTS_031189 [Danionella translucida]